MARKKLKDIKGLTIEKVAAEGNCLGHDEEGRIVFVSHAAPGDVMDVRVVKKRKKFIQAAPEVIHTFSDLRQEPLCEHYGLCGGCKWQHLKYEHQVEFKTQVVRETMEHLGKIEIPEIPLALGSEKTEFYRNKMEFSFTNFRWLTKEEIASEENQDRRGLGFHIPGGFDKIIHVNKCWLQPDPSNAIRTAIDTFAKENEIPYYNVKFQEGHLRNVTIRTANTTGQIMVILQVFTDEEKWTLPLVDHLKAEFPEITSLYYVVNKKGNETIFDQELILHHGTPYIEETMEDLTYRVGPKSFYQTNSEQAYQLYSVTRDFAGLTGEEVVYDLYTGTGTIANFVAKKAKQVVGIEYVEAAIEDAKINSEINKVENTLFYAGDMKNVLTDEFAAKHPAPDVVITDPPRAGMDTEVVEMLLKLAPKRIVYVSCNPATQARDLNLLDAKYKVTKIQPVDMFPHTHHIENVVALELK
ncbi:23S rRNA (uracil(1939)-C(5))-methyltransferase RlmD [Persicobacter sp. CCB-QB2]|uniref:23S rRNA (uracil(1939)-C(5))-methyltransferase RlmD n=1 Tax=Persicobacter sp. CCB-QB2 TaxID=1561025 RepID=UPI0006A94D6A|nr:23S rRNA (uracil(1939)-C(5))-methyltransferase RlmD [Persicobacter sp. CCB-QB2]